MQIKKYMRNTIIGGLLILSGCHTTTTMYQQTIIGSWIQLPFNGVRITKDSIYSAEHFTNNKYRIIDDSIEVEFPGNIVRNKIVFFGKDSFYIGQPLDSSNPIYLRVKK